jgi:transcription-repair coupling factor (superfamily II helicase)
VSKLDAGPKGAVATFREHAFADPVALIDLMTRRPADYKLRPDNTMVLRGDFPDVDGRLKGVQKLLAPLADAAQRAKKQAA